MRLHLGRIALGLVSGSLLATSLAHAAGTGAAPPPLHYLVNDSYGIPPSGGLLFSSDGAGAPIVLVTDAQGVQVPGTVYERGDYHVWVADAPLSLGESYSVEARSELGGSLQSWTVNVVAPEPSLWPTLEAAPTVMSASQTTDDLCCSEYSRSYPVVTCSPLKVAISAQVIANLTSATSAATRDQLIYSVRPAGYLDSVNEVTAASSFVPWLERNFPVTFSEPADAYCLEIAAMNIVTGEIHTYREPDTYCVAHGSLPAFGETSLDPVVQGSLEAVRCAVPPADWADTWCQVNRACQADRAGLGCESYGYVCEGEPLPDATQTAGTGGGTAGAGTAGTSAAGTGAPDDASSAKHAGWCSVASVGAASPDSRTSLPLFAAASVLAALVTRRRRTRRSDAD